jgi:hypothetical protein
MQETAESSGGTHQHGGAGFFSGRVKNKLTAELDDIIFGQSLGEGKSLYFRVRKREYWITEGRT